ncbi:MAG: hypothetical protein HOE48_09940 [Candidatus Latescibacteria bacterium]|jgi:hypothetical protein|nr:hypothetical protein [Candidatus Latescibacterota bacterium]MBT4138227.1 hypothetical protein [Candidatus Latescibacterota bacterium]MBT5830731.1 hypothetical protein [Candidatus Latescibacterota bacterium]
MRNFILKIHLYGGLLCSPYLIIFGLSSLQFNHHFVQPNDDEVTWTHPLRLDPTIEKRNVGNAVRDSLGLIGWGPWWNVEQDETETRVEVVRPGKKYQIHIKDGLAEIEETRLGYLTIVNSLHALTRVPNAPFMSVWGIYTEICTWVVLFSAGSGVYLWTARKSERHVGWLLICGGAGSTLLLILYVLVWG